MEKKNINCDGLYHNNFNKNPIAYLLDHKKHLIIALAVYSTKDDMNSKILYEKYF